MNFKLMNWNKCKKEFIRNVEKDLFQIESLKEIAEKRFQRARKETDESFIVEDYYEGIKELLVAYLLKKGMRSKNHQCLFSYIKKEFPEKDYEINVLLQLSHYRNRLSYYGEKVPKKYIIFKKKEIEKIIQWVKNLLKD